MASAEAFWSHDDQNASAKPSEPKKKRPTIVGRATATAKPGASKTVVVGLNKVGAKLLAKRHQLSLTVTVSTGKSVLKHGSVMLKPKPR